MYISTRRAALLGSAASLLFGCSNGTIGGTPIPMAKAYADDLADALSAGADTYLARTTPPVPTASEKAAVLKAKDDIQQAKAALDAALTTTTVPQNTRDIVKQVIADAHNIAPYVAPLLGPAALYIDLALGVLQSFADSLPPPPTAPQTPPAALAEKAKAYRRGARK